MAWIESHQSLRDHPKLAALCALMDWDVDTSIGKLHRFWWWCLDYAIDGDLRKFNDAQLAHGMGVAIPSAGKLKRAMVESCWIDREPYFRVHDWWDYVGKFLKIKWKDHPDKWQAVRDRYATIPVTPPVTPPATPTTNQPTDLPTEFSLLGREEPDPNIWPMKPTVVTPPVDENWTDRIESLHAWYGQQMGSPMRLDDFTRRLWWEWFKAGYDEDAFKLTFRYLRSQVKIQKRNDGALLLRNMLQPDQFEGDRVLAVRSRKPLAPSAPQPTEQPKAYDATKGGELIKALKEAVK